MSDYVLGYRGYRGPTTDGGFMNGHTPGPWRLGAKGRTQDIKAQANVVVARVESLFDLKEGDAESQANAKLIAAAPDLLSVVKDLLDIVKDEYEHDPEPDDLGFWQDAITAAKAVIKKAEGRVKV